MGRTTIEKVGKQTIIRLPEDAPESVLQKMEALVAELNAEAERVAARKEFGLLAAKYTDQGLDEDNPETQRIIEELTEEVKEGVWQRYKAKHYSNEGPNS